MSFRFIKMRSYLVSEVLYSCLLDLDIKSTHKYFCNKLKNKRLGNLLTRNLPRFLSFKFFYKMNGRIGVLKKIKSNSMVSVPPRFWRLRLPGLPI